MIGAHRNCKRLTSFIILIVVPTLVLVSLAGCITINPPSAPIPTPTPTPAPGSTPPSPTEALPTIDFLEFPAKGEEYTYATIKIKASKPGAYSLALVDEQAAGPGSADRVYELGTILTDDYGVGKWHFRVDKDFELDRVQIRYRDGERSFLVVDMLVI